MIIRTDFGKNKSNIAKYAQILTNNIPFKIIKLEDLTWSLTFKVKIGWFYHFFIISP
jgi:hypothetical protein